MKKWIVLLLFTCFAAGALLSLEPVSKWFLPTVEIVVLKPSDIQQTVQCTGKIVVEGQEEITLELPVVVGSVLVEEGDTVKKDQLLLTVDRDETLNYIYNMEDPVVDLSQLAEQPDSVPNEIRAPADGRVLSLGAGEGDAVLPDTALVTIAHADSLQIEANISEEMISDVRVGQRAVITGSGFKGREYGGVVSGVRSSAKQVNTTTGAVTVVGTVIAINDADEYLRPGYTANIEIITDTAEDRLVVPYETVSQDGDGQEYMYVYSAGWIARRDIVSNRETAEGIEVVGGVSAGETVAVDPGRLSGPSLRVKAVRGGVK